MKRALLTLFVVAVLVGVGGFAFVYFNKEDAPQEPAPAAPVPATEVVGYSVQGRAIVAYTYGKGPQHLLFVGGIHGGYEWNSVALAYEMIDYLKANPNTIPANITVSIIPSLNPDGVYKVTGGVGRFTVADVTTNTVTLASARFNANNIDLNRNFDCKWQPNSTWRSEVVSAGSTPFSEPEAKALRAFVTKHVPEAVVFWHSQANAVYASECEEGILPNTLTIMNAYAKAAGYAAVESFDAYAVTGDAEGWLASIGIPAITVELSSHELIEFDRNLAGTQALLEVYKR